MEGNGRGGARHRSIWDVREDASDAAASRQKVLIVQRTSGTVGGRRSSWVALTPMGSPPHQESPFVSVVVPVFNDHQRLRVCLEALMRQSYPPDCYEVLVVDNGSTDPVSSIVDSRSCVRVLTELRPGSYAARNTGIRAARGLVIAFTDSDCLPDPHWISEGVRSLQLLPGAGVIAGRIERFGRNPVGLSLPEMYDATFFMHQDAYVARGGFGATANLIVHAEVFRRIGPFDAALKSGGDAEWGQRASRQGIPLRYEPGVVVRHPNFSTMGAALRKARRVVGGHVQRRMAKGYDLRELAVDVAGDFRGIRTRWGQFRALHARVKPSVRVRMSMLIALLQLARAIERLRLFAGGLPKRQ